MATPHDNDPEQKPVLFCIFNRPDLALRTFEAIREARPPALYVVADGARGDRDGETALCQATREVTENVDWPCRVERRYRDVNWGCRASITDGITWFFENEEDGIILEEDVLPSPAFFRFCSTMLNRYAEDERVMMISGNNFLDPSQWKPGGYFFSIWIHVWGWASWRRAWKSFRCLDDGWAAYSRSRQFRKWIGSRRGVEFWTRQLGQAVAGKVDSWAFQWAYSVWSRQGLSILPGSNLIRNIGFDHRALHTRQPQRHCMEWGDLIFPLRDPEQVRPNRLYERALYRMHMRPRGLGLRSRMACFRKAR